MGFVLGLNFGLDTALHLYAIKRLALVVIVQLHGAINLNRRVAVLEVDPLELVNAVEVDNVLEVPTEDQVGTGDRRGGDVVASARRPADKAPASIYAWASLRPRHRSEPREYNLPEGQRDAAARPLALFATRST